MRLRLIVRRNGLPDSHILWSSTGLNSTPSSSSNTKTTIAEFLHEIDDVIPLESEDWGIEDYVVEVGGFECVHYSALESLLKEDDEVVYVAKGYLHVAAYTDGMCLQNPIYYPP